MLMMKTACFHLRCRTPLAGAALLLLAAGCSTFQPDAGTGSGSPRVGDTPTPDTTGPHPVYIINDGADANVPADVKPGLIVNLGAAGHPGEDAGVVDSYEVPKGAGQSVLTTGPHPIIQINLPVEAPAPSGTRRANASTGPRTVVVVMGAGNPIIHGSGRRTIVVHICLPLQSGEVSALPTTMTAAGTMHRRRSDTR